MKPYSKVVSKEFRTYYRTPKNFYCKMDEESVKTTVLQKIVNLVILTVGIHLNHPSKLPGTYYKEGVS